MKPFSINISWRDSNDKFKYKFSEEVEADSLVELLAKFQFVLIKIMEQMKQEEIMQIKFPRIEGQDDDIPF